MSHREYVIGVELRFADGSVTPIDERHVRELYKQLWLLTMQGAITAAVKLHDARGPLCDPRVELTELEEKAVRVALPRAERVLAA